jgi:quercetin dioxygenase-like cupin family protein
MTVRRLVTGHDTNRRSIVAHDGTPPWSKDFEHTPGFSSSVVWLTPANASPDARDPTTTLTSIVPGPGGTSFLMVTFPPDSVMVDPTFDASAAGREQAEQSPGLVEFFEPDAPGMHTTPTIDYGIVLEGEIWLELDDGHTVHLEKHDVFVQNATRHAWRNKSATPTKMAFVLIGCDSPPRRR